MEASIDHYLSVVEKQLKSMPLPERVDTLSEIQSHFEEIRFFNNASTSEALAELGDPRTLASACLQESIAKTSGINGRKLWMLASLHCSNGLASLIVMSTLSVLALCLIICGIVLPIVGMLATGGYLFGYELSFFVIQKGSLTLHPLFVFPVMLGLGLLLILGGTMCWRFMKNYHNSANPPKEISGVSKQIP